MKKLHDKQRVFTLLALLGLLAGGLILNGCNTWHGAGKDVERAGEKIQGKP